MRRPSMLPRAREGTSPARPSPPPRGMCQAHDPPPPPPPGDIPRTYLAPRDMRGACQGKTGQCRCVAAHGRIVRHHRLLTHGTDTRRWGPSHSLNCTRNAAVTAIKNKVLLAAAARRNLAGSCYERLHDRRSWLVCVHLDVEDSSFSVPSLCCAFACAVVLLASITRPDHKLVAESSRGVSALADAVNVQVDADWLSLSQGASCIAAQEPHVHAAVRTQMNDFTVLHHGEHARLGAGSCATRLGSSTLHFCGAHTQSQLRTTEFNTYSTRIQSRRAAPPSRPVVVGGGGWVRE